LGTSLEQHLMPGGLFPCYHRMSNEESSMPEQESRLKVRKVDGVVQIEFLDRNILDEANIQAIADEVGAIIDAEATPKVVLCFSNVEHLSSAALGALITINKKIRAKSGQLRLTNIDPQIYQVFQITRLNKMFQIHPTVSDAVRSFT
jgi:anti-sigma B factor antagonist